MTVKRKQGSYEGKLSIFGFEHDDVYGKVKTAIDGAGEAKIVGRTIYSPIPNAVKPQGTGDVELKNQTLICECEDESIHYVEGPFPILTKNLQPIVNAIKSSCSIAGSRVKSVTRKTMGESL